MDPEKEKIIIEIEGNGLEEIQENKDVVRVLGFSLCDEVYCINITQAREVIRLPESTRVPNTPEFVVGVINLRGEIVPVIDLRYFFGLDIRERTEKTRLIVTDVIGSPVGVLVDNIKYTMDIEKENIQPPLATLGGKLAPCTIGQVQLEEEILIYLDFENIFKTEEIEQLKKGGDK